MRRLLLPVQPPVRADDDEPCGTFRPNHPEGLRPPQQLRFTFRQERRTRVGLGVPLRPGAGRAARADRSSTRLASRSVRLTVLGKSPSYTDAGGACSGYLIEEDDTIVLLDCGNGVFAKLRTLRGLRRRRRGRHLAPARRPRPRPRAVRLRARLRAAPAAGAGRALARHRQPGAAGAARAAGRARLLPPRRRGVGERGPHREGVRPARVRLRRGARDRRHPRALPPVPHFTPTQAVELRSANGGGRIVYGADHRPSEEVVRFADGRRPRAARGDAPAARARRRPRPPHPARGRRARQGRATRSGSSSPTSPTRWTTSGRATARREAFGAPVDVAAEGAVYEV